MKKILFVISTLLFISCQKDVVEYKLTVNSNPELGGLYSQEVDRLKDWIENRMNWLNENF
tara:strand:+ start:1480 stop:1659 length:180 start_codon:yes stop_codon:yes gene_type:complete